MDALRMNGRLLGLASRVMDMQDFDVVGVCLIEDAVPDQRSHTNPGALFDKARAIRSLR